MNAWLSYSLISSASSVCKTALAPWSSSYLLFSLIPMSNLNEIFHAFLQVDPKSWKLVNSISMIMAVHMLLTAQLKSAGIKKKVLGLYLLLQWSNWHNPRLSKVRQIFLLLHCITLKKPIFFLFGSWLSYTIVLICSMIQHFNLWLLITNMQKYEGYIGICVLTDINYPNVTGNIFFLICFRFFFF